MARLANRITRRLGFGLVSRHDLDLLNTVRESVLSTIPPRHRYSLPQRRLGHAGFALDDAAPLALLDSLRAAGFQELFAALRGNPEINTGFLGRNYASAGLIHNGFYPTPDAELYAAMIRLHRPDRIIEIGSGYSTVIARTTIDSLGLDCRIHSWDPRPRRDIGHYAHQMRYEPVESGSLTPAEFTDRTLLFIDSSHACRSGGDLPFLYCQLLPALTRPVLIHVHDVFTPWDYPDDYLERFYTEQYLLQAWLAHSPELEVVFATHHMARQYPERMQAAFGKQVGVEPLFCGASFWVRKGPAPR